MGKRVDQSTEAKSESDFDKNLENERQKASSEVQTNTEKGKKKMKPNTKKRNLSLIFAWIGWAIIALAIVFWFAYWRGYNAKVADTERINTEVAKQVAKLKQQP